MPSGEPPICANLPARNRETSHPPYPSSTNTNCVAILCSAPIDAGSAAVVVSATSSAGDLLQEAADEPAQALMGQELGADG